jgi:anionic cell wall polymer biosynthesis LytR-Cps2A-Psr (LCP) family protein
MALLRRKDPLWARILLVAGVALTVLSGGTLVAAQTLISQATGSITQTDLIGADGVEGGNDIDGAVNLLLVGIDARENEKEFRSDTIIILHVPASHDQAYLISIPRDWVVDIPASGKLGFDGSTEKINAAFFYGSRVDGTDLEKRARGMELLSSTLRNETGIQFNGGAIIDFGGFHSIIHALGGVDMCVDEEAASSHIGVNDEGHLYQGYFDDATERLAGLPPGYRPFVHRVGCRLMNATEALDYARIRKSFGNGDYGRQRHQQQLIKAMAKKATSSGVLTDFGKLKGLMDAAGEALTLDTRGTDLTDFIFTLRGVAANDLMLIKTNAGELNTIQAPDGSEAEDLTAESLQMIKAANDGTLGAFLIEHPQFIARSA